MLPLFKYFHIKIQAQILNLYLNVDMNARTELPFKIKMLELC